MGHSWLLFLGSKEGWRNQQTAALPDYLSSFSSLHPCFWHTLILIIFQDSVLTNGLSAYVNHILQDKPKKVLHPNRREEREPLQNPKLVVLHIKEATMCTTHSRPPGQACRSPPNHPSKPPGLPVGVHIGGGQHTFARKYKTKRAHRNVYKMHNLYYRYW